MRLSHRPLHVAISLVLATLSLAACTDSSATSTADESANETADAAPDDTTGEPNAAEPATVRLLTHDSFNVSEELLAAFTSDTGISIEILRGGDAGTMVNQAILTAGNPQADVMFGIDNALLSRALEAEVFAAGALRPVPDSVDPALLVDDDRVVPIDRGDVCLNYDVAAFTDADLTVPATLDDLTDPAYAGMLAVENPATSSPGLAFLLATISHFGDEWAQFWTDLVANDVSVSAGWEQAYYGEFSGSAGSAGTRPLVVSYASSPPAEVIFAEEPLDIAPTGVIPETCVRQVEYAGVLAGSDNIEAAATVVDWMLSADFQADIPLSMFVFPARTDVDLPPEFVEHTTLPEDPIELDPVEVAANRDDWIDEWTRIVLG